MKNTIYSGILICSILFLAACNGDTEPVQQVNEEEEAGLEVSANSPNEGNSEIAISTLLSELKNELVESIAEHTEVEKDAISIMLDGASVDGNIEVTCAIGLPEETEVDDTTVQQLVEHIKETVSKKENVTISEDDIEIAKTDGEILKGFK